MELNIDYQSNFAKKRYKELQNKKPQNLTKKEKDFVRYMYHIEEARAGLL